MDQDQPSSTSSDGTSSDSTGQSAPPESSQPAAPGDAAPFGYSAPNPETPGYALPPGYPAHPQTPPQAMPHRRRNPALYVRLAIAAVVVVGGGVGALVNHLNSAKRSSNGQISRSGSLQVTDLKQGDCFNGPKGNSGTAVQSVKAIPCTSPHDSQIYAVYNLSEGPDASYPSNSALQKEGGKGCDARLVANLDKSKITKSMEESFLVPDQNGWGNGDRSVSCIVSNPTATLKSSLLKG